MNNECAKRVYNWLTKKGVHAVQTYPVISIEYKLGPCNAAPSFIHRDPQILTRLDKVKPTCHSTRAQGVKEGSWYDGHGCRALVVLVEITDRRPVSEGSKEVKAS